MGEFFVYSAFFGTLLFFLPVFVYFDGYLDVRENRVWFALSAYKYLKIIGGYGQLDAGGAAVHLTKNTALYIPFADMANMRKKFEITKGFQLYIFHQIVEAGGAQSVYGVLLAAFIQSVSGGTFAVLKTKHPFLSLKNSTLLTDRTDLKLSVHTAVVFNGFVLTLAIVKKLLEAIINWKNKKRSTAFWKKQHSSSQASST